MLRVNALSGFGASQLLFPEVAGRATSQEGGTTAHTVSLPSNVGEGDILVAFVVVDTASNSFTWPGSWVELDEQNHTGLDMTVGYLKASGGETSVDVASTASCNGAYIAYRITGAYGVPEISASATGNSSNPNPPSLTPSWGRAKKTLWLAGAGHQSGSAFTGAPSGYSNMQTRENNRSLATAELQSFVGSENPGTFTAAASGTWVAYTVAMRGR